MNKQGYTRTYTKYFNSETGELRLFPIEMNYDTIRSSYVGHFFVPFNNDISIDFNPEGEVVFNSNFYDMLKLHKPKFVAIFGMGEDGNAYQMLKYKTEYKYYCSKCKMVRLVSYTTPAVIIIVFVSLLIGLFTDDTKSLHESIESALRSIHDTPLSLSLIYVGGTYLIYFDLITRFLL